MTYVNRERFLLGIFSQLSHSLEKTLASPEGTQQVCKSPFSNMPWFLYLVKCRDGSLYTGITTDISRRLKEHNAQKGAFYTQNKTPVELVYQEAMANQSQASKRESQIKRLTRAQKLELISQR